MVCLIGKVRLKNKQNSCHIGSCQDIIELYEIQDGLALCDTLSNDDVCKQIDIICLEYILLIVLYYCIIIIIVRINVYNFVYCIYLVCKFVVLLY